MELRDAYRVLEIAVGASEDAVRDARKTLAKVWHPDRHANDPELAKKAEAKLADVNTAFETIRKAKFPSSIPEPVPVATSAPRPEPPKPDPPMPTLSKRDAKRADKQANKIAQRYLDNALPRRRVRWSVILVLAAALGVGVYFAVVKLARGVERVTARDDDRDPPPPPSADASVAPQPLPGGPTFDIGSTEAQVRNAQGEPEQIQDALGLWHYGFSTVHFEGGQVVGYWNSDHNLRVQLRPRDRTVAERAAARGTIRVGSTKDEIIAVQGTPERIDKVVTLTWTYPDGSSIDFDERGRAHTLHDFGTLKVAP